MKTVVLPSLLMGEDEEVTVRIEVFRGGDRRRPYYPVVWFVETFRMRPTFPLFDDPPRRVDADNDVAYVQDAWGFEELRGRSAAEVLRAVLRKFAELLPDQVSVAPVRRAKGGKKAARRHRAR